MTTPLVLTFDQILSAWEALTPPDRTETTYHRAPGKAPKEGHAGDREIYLGLPNRVRVEGIKDRATSQIAWEFDLFVRLSLARYSQIDQMKAIANELNLLARTVEKQSSWPAGVLYCQLVSTDVLRDDDTADVVLVYNFDAQCEETD